MGKNNSRYLFAAVDGALAVLFFGFLLSIYFIDGGRHFESILGLFLIFFGMVMVLFMLLIRRAHFLFFGICFVLSGVTWLVVTNKSVSVSASEIWPFNGISFVIALLVSCYYKYRRLKMTYLIPSVIIFTLSIIFILFSFRMISIPFRYVVLLLIPVCWVIVICWYFIQKFIGVDGDARLDERGEVK